MDALENDAGVATYGAVEDLPITVFQSTRETKYLGCSPVHQSRLLPSMREGRAGCIVNVSSIPGALHRAATKEVRSVPT
jgi:NAD(P)-dependent dehydrogenase (short-subunit alcohol dehydrogenase family)